MLVQGCSRKWCKGHNEVTPPPPVWVLITGIFIWSVNVLLIPYAGEMHPHPPTFPNSKPQDLLWIIRGMVEIAQCDIKELVCSFMHYQTHDTCKRNKINKKIKMYQFSNKSKTKIFTFLSITWICPSTSIVCDVNPIFPVTAAIWHLPVCISLSKSYNGMLQGTMGNGRPYWRKICSTGSASSGSSSIRFLTSRMPLIVLSWLSYTGTLEWPLATICRKRNLGIYKYQVKPVNWGRGPGHSNMYCLGGLLLFFSPFLF